MADCPQDPSIPTVDNSAMICDQLISALCVVTSETNLFFNVAKGSTLTHLVNNIERVYKQIQSASSTNTAAIQQLQPIYKNYAGFLTQSGTNVPSATAKESTLTGVSITRTGVGTYTFTLTGGFPDGRTVVTPPKDLITFTSGNETARNVYSMERVDANTVILYTARATNGGAAVLMDGLLDGNKSFFEIKVYNS